jgi:hypothetical protein
MIAVFELCANGVATKSADLKAKATIAMVFQRITGQLNCVQIEND